MSDPEADISISAAPRSLVGLGFAVAVVPFFVSVSSSSSVYENGRLVAASYRDNVALGCGAVAALLGVIAAILARRPSLQRTKHIAAAVALVALGGYQVARGLGVFAPKPEPANEPFVAQPSGPPREETPPAGPKPVCVGAKACNELGRSLDATDPAGAYAAYAEGCGPEGRGNCYNAGLALRDGTGIKKDAPKAVAMLDKACGYGMQLACSNLGAILLDGDDGVPVDAARAQKLFDAACTAGDGLGCNNLGATREKADPAKAVESYRKACDLNSPLGCDNLGVALYTGAGVPKDGKAALAAFARACGIEDEPECFNYAVLLDEGKIVKRDSKAARELYGRACEHDRRACNNLGTLHRDGQGGPKDLVRAKALYVRACDMGLDLACTNRDELAGAAKAPTK